MNPQDLQSLGFTASESKIYLALLEQGPCLAGKLSKITQINRRTTYDTIERLVEKGLVSYSLEANRRVFKANNPSLILERIKDSEDAARELIPGMLKSFQASKSEQEANIYRGRKGIRTILNEMLKERSYRGFGSNERFPELMGHDFESFQRQKKELGIKSKTLMAASMRGNPLLAKANTTYRFLKEKISQPTSTFIYGSKVAIIIWSETPVGTVIENKELVATYKSYFQELWDNASLP